MISFSHLKHSKQVINLNGLNLDEERRFITDTRVYRDRDVFIAIPGQRVNPLNLIRDLLRKGLDIVFFQALKENEEIVKNYQSEFPKAIFVAVKDSIEFIQELAHLHIKSWLEDEDNILFAISGSNGKTTHKEMLSHIMNEILPGQVVFTQKNNNNHLGVPLTLLDVNKNTRFVILELGSNHPGEIKFLCDLALPNSGITTNIGATHLEFFGTEKEVFLEEGYLYQAVKDNTDGKGFYLINDDDSFLKTLKDTEGSKRFGKSSNVELKLSFFKDGARLRDVEVHNQYITGEHNKSNLVTCAYIAWNFFPQHQEQIIKAASRFRPTANRSQWMRKEEAHIFLDAYNANPSSMKVALQGFKEHLLDLGLELDQSLIILGDMNELGVNSSLYHEELGTYVAELGFSHLFFIGRFAQDYLRGAQKGKTYLNVSEFRSDYQKKYLKELSHHFIKGSRSLQLESLFDIT